MHTPHDHGRKPSRVHDFLPWTPVAGACDCAIGKRIKVRGGVSSVFLSCGCRRVVDPSQSKMACVVCFFAVLMDTDRGKGLEAHGRMLYRNVLIIDLPSGMSSNVVTSPTWSSLRYYDASKFTSRLQLYLPVPSRIVRWMFKLQMTVMP